VTTVLVVDDEPDILLLHRINLEAAGHRVVLAADGVTALERIAAEEPDAVVLDVLMPVLDGWSVLEELRNRPSAPPVLVVSAHFETNGPHKAVELGAYGYLNKPYDPDVLIARVREMLASRRDATDGG
jgi:DNA-binding response OmpR family regulator